MQSRFYSTDLRRFINADLLHGDITNSLTLNRYAYCNGDPVNGIDPLGLSKERGDQLDLNSIYNILNQISDKSDYNAALKALSGILDQMMLFKDNFVISAGENPISIYLGLNTILTYSTNVSHGSGNINLSAVFSDQLDIAASFSFETSDYFAITMDENEIGIEYSTAIDEYTSITASVSTVPFVFVSAAYTISTTDKYDNTVSSTWELTQFNSPIKPPSNETKQETNSDLLQTAGKVVVAAGATVVLVAAVAETVATLGAGIWNDIPALVACIESWRRVLATATP